MFPSQDIRLGNIYLNSESYLAGMIADCDAKPARYRAVLDASPATVAVWMPSPKLSRPAVPAYMITVAVIAEFALAAAVPAILLVTSSPSQRPGELAPPTLPGRS